MWVEQLVQIEHTNKLKYDKDKRVPLENNEQESENMSVDSAGVSKVGSSIHLQCRPCPLQE